MDKRLKQYLNNLTIEEADHDLDKVNDLLSQLSEKQLKSLIGLAGLMKLVAIIDDQELCPDEESEITKITTSVFLIEDLDVKKIIIFLKVLMPYLKKQGMDYFCQLIKETCNTSQFDAVIQFLQRIAAADDQSTPQQQITIHEIDEELKG